MGNKAIWVFIGSREVGSSRIHGYNIHKKLKELGYNSHLLYEPAGWLDKYILNKQEPKLIKALNPNDVFILQKIKTPDYIPLVKKLKAKGVKTVFIDSDLPIPKFYLDCFDTIICPSKYLKEIYEKHGFRNVVELIDIPEVTKWEETKKFKKKCVWFGQSSGNKWNEVEYIKNIFTEYNIRWSFETISNTSLATHKWNCNSYNKIAEFDAVLIPVLEKDFDKTKVKSSNRVLQSMALGVPVLAHEIPSYGEIIKSKENGFLINQDEEWSSFLKLLEDETYRETIRNNAYQTSLKYKIDNYITEWIKTLSLDKQAKNKEVSKKLLNISKSIYRELGLYHIYYRKMYFKLEKNKIRIWYFKVYFTFLHYSKAIYRRIISIKKKKKQIIS